MLKLERVKKDERLLRALTGLNLKALEQLKAAFAEALLEAPIPRRSKKLRSPNGLMTSMILVIRFTWKGD